MIMDKGEGRVALLTGSVCSDQFPVGLRVLVVDDDPICLMILEKMLRNCMYEVTTCSRAVDALSMLRERKDGFDLVISDVYMPDMDGFKLLEHIGLEMGLPVIMMSIDDKKDVVMKGVTHGACDYLIKPLRIEAIKNIWQHVVRKRGEVMDLEQTGSVEDRKQLEDADYASSANEGNWGHSKKRKEARDEEEEGEDREDSSTLKKPRVVWTVELHQQFVAAVNQLSIDKAVPKKILELMNVPGLTRENVASHLQKYRSYLRRLSGAPQHQGGVNTSFVGTPEATFGSTSSLDGLNLQHALAISCQLLPHNIPTSQAGLRRTISSTNMGISLPDQVNIFSPDAQFENASKIRYETGQHLGNKQVDLLQGLPITMEQKQLMHLYQHVHSFENMRLHSNKVTPGFLPLPTPLRTSPSSHADIVHGNQSSSLIMQMTQQRQQLPVSQSQRQADISLQSQSRGHLLDENASGPSSELPSSVGQQIISNEIVGRVLGRNATVINGRDTSSWGTCINNSKYVAVSQGSSVDFAFGDGMELPGNGFALASTEGLSSFTPTRMFQAMPVGSMEGLESTNLKISTGPVQSYNHFNEVRHIKNQDWELQNSNITYDVSQHVNPMPSNHDSNPSVLDHQGFTANQHGRQNRSAHFSGQGMVPLRVENESGNPEGIAQCHNNVVLDSSFRVKAGSVHNFSCESMLLTENKQQQEGVGLGEAEFNFGGYSMDNISM